MPVPILCYHKVSADESQGRWLNVHPRRLREHVRFFKRRGFPFKTVASLADRWPARAVCFTFDDAYVSAVTSGIEVLNAEGVAATFYVVSSNVGRTSDWDSGRAAPLASWDQLKVAAKSGHEIGNHTASHVKLGQLSLQEQLSEIACCRDELSAQGFGLGSCCFPYGSFSDSTIQALETCGYRVGVALGKRAALPSDLLLALPRIVMAYGDSLPMLIYKLYVRPRIG